MSELRKQLDNALLRLQDVIDENFEEVDSIQTAFNQLCCAIDEQLEQE